MVNEFIILILWQIMILFRNVIPNYHFISSKYISFALETLISWKS